MISKRYRGSLDGPSRATPTKYYRAPEPYQRHSGRTCCSYCGVTLTNGVGSGNDERTWDHIVPASIGGRITVPACSWCNGKKAASSLGDWLVSSALEFRRSLVAARDDSADPMQEKILVQLRDEDLARLRASLDYHSKRIDL